MSLVQRYWVCLPSLIGLAFYAVGSDSSDPNCLVYMSVGSCFLVFGAVLVFRQMMQERN